MDAAALFISIISALGTGAAAIIAWASRADSLKAADRAENAQDAALEAARQAVEAHKTASSALANLAFTSGPPWTMAHRKGDTYLLTNESNRAALDVEVTSVDPSIVNEDQPNLPSRIGPKSAGYFAAGYSIAEAEFMIVVRWHFDGEAEPREWRYPLPPTANSLLISDPKT